MGWRQVVYDESEDIYGLVAYDPEVCTQEAYDVYSNEIKRAHDELMVVHDSLLKLDMTDVEQSRKFAEEYEVFRERTATFQERKRFLEANLPNLDVMDSMA
jgi:CO dehydrogenase/acetyl-CoA synthase epsilon subunit